MPRRTSGHVERRIDHAVGSARPLVASLVLLLLFCVAFQAGAAGDRASPLRITNPTFLRGPDAEHPVEDWLFRERAPGAACVRAREERGAMLLATSDLARGDLMCQPFALEPWREVEITVEVEGVLGAPVVFVGLRPWKNRVLVDQDFLPAPVPGRRRKSTLLLHAGLTGGEYTIQVSISGKGVARIKSIEAKKKGHFKRPERPTLVLDVLNNDCPPDYKLRWTKIDKLRTVFGFPEIHSRHFSVFSQKDLDTIRPGLLLISGTGGVGDGKQEMLQAIRVLRRYPAPLVGICGGHQYLAQCQSGHAPFKLKEKVTGPTRISIVEDDAIFASLPRRPLFVAHQNHSWAVAQPPGTIRLATSKSCRNEVLVYGGKPWYTFQCHIEADWHGSCAEGTVIWKNLLRRFRLIE